MLNNIVTVFAVTMLILIPTMLFLLRPKKTWEDFALPLSAKAMQRGFEVESSKVGCCGEVIIHPAGARLFYVSVEVNGAGEGKWHLGVYSSHLQRGLNSEEAYQVVEKIIQLKPLVKSSTEQNLYNLGEPRWDKTQEDIFASLEIAGRVFEEIKGSRERNIEIDRLRGIVESAENNLKLFRKASIDKITDRVMGGLKNSF